MKKVNLATVLGFFAILMAVMTTELKADIGVGVSYISGDIEAEGHEDHKNHGQAAGTSENHRSTHDGLTTSYDVGSVFVEYIFENNASIGIDYIPGEASIGSGSRTTTDRVATTDADTSITQKASAEFSEHVTIYAEGPVMNISGQSLYVTGGMHQVSVDTLENLGTGSSYKNADILGGMVGIGIKGGIGESGFYYKLASKYSNYEDVVLTAQGTDKASRVTAQLESINTHLSVGFRF
jgi:hypothetical protein